MNAAGTAAAPITPAELDQLRNHLVLRPKDRKLWRDIGRDSVAKLIVALDVANAEKAQLLEAVAKITAKIEERRKANAEPRVRLF